MLEELLELLELLVLEELEVELLEVDVCPPPVLVVLLEPWAPPLPMKRSSVATPPQAATDAAIRAAVVIAGATWFT